MQNLKSIYKIHPPYITPRAEVQTRLQLRGPGGGNESYHIEPISKTQTTRLKINYRGEAREIFAGKGSRTSR